MDFIKHDDLPEVSEAPEIGSKRCFIPAVFLYAQGGSSLTSCG